MNLFFNNLLFRNSLSLREVQPFPFILLRIEQQHIDNKIGYKIIQEIHVECTFQTTLRLKL